MLIKLAWRNIWRNKRRSAIVLSSIVFGYAALVFLDGLTTGMVFQMLDNRIGIYTAQLEVHHAGFLESGVLENRIGDPGDVAAVLDRTAGIDAYSGRVLTFGMLSSASGSAGVTVVGVDPERESAVTQIAQLVRAGSYLSGAGREILLSERLADKIGVGLGEKVVGMASGLGGEIGSDLFRVVGLYRTYDSGFDETHAYVDAADAQRMLSLGSDIMEFAVVCKSTDLIEAVKQSLSRSLGDRYEVSTYRELLPLLVAQLDIYRQMMLVIYAIGGLAIVLGIVNTMLMAVYERIHEFGVLFAVGMKRRSVFSMVLLEALSLGAAGTVMGIGAGAALTASFMKVGIDLSMFEESLAAFGAGAVIHPQLTIQSLFSAAVVVPLVSVLGAMYPGYRATTFEPVEAIRFV
jgi:putative ABC transport system permease protein